MKCSASSCGFLAAVLSVGCSTSARSVDPTARVRDTATPTTAQQLDELGERLERARVEAEVPGMAVAVVRGDEVLLARGFGVADQQRGTAVDVDTQFAIGSCTKAFTATVVGMLIDEGTMRWEAPVSQALPELDLPGVTLMDLATHRSGRARMMDPMLLGMAPLDAPTLFAHAAAARIAHEPGTALEYLNVGYIALGEASARASGMPWDQLVQTRVFDPLGMTHTRATPPRPNDPLAVGYQWHEGQQQHIPRPTHGRDGGAGAIRSTARDMARWLQFQLANGTVGDTRLIAASTLAQTRSPQVDLGGDRGYGLGWIVDDDGWNGHRIIEHRGNTDGFSAVVAMAPDDDLGVVMMMNAAYRAEVVFPGPELVWEALLPPPQPVAPAVREDYDALVGVYRGSIPGQGERRFDFFVEDGVLMGGVDIEVIPATPVEAPDADGLRALRGVPGIRVSFVRDPSGRASAFVLHQDDFAFEIPREGIAVPTEVSHADVADQLGSYRSVDGTAVEVRIHRGRLALEWGPSATPLPAGTYDLQRPDAQGRWSYRSNPSYGATFGPQALTLDGGGRTVEFRRLDERSASHRKTLDALERLRRPRYTALSTVGSIRLQRDLHYPFAGVTGTGSLRFDTSRIHAAWDLAELGHGTHIIDHGTHHETTSLGAFEGLQARLIAAARAEQPRIQFGDWRSHFDAVEVIGHSRDDGHPVALVRLTGSGDRAHSMWVDLETGDVRRLHQRVPMPEFGTEVAVVTEFSEFRTIRGIRIPHRAQLTVGDGFNVMVETVTEVTVERDS
ncbi:MAG: serine hydrolase domain-containing protein [Myxococcota bacterium]